jgi:hypothetical protein
MTSKLQNRRDATVKQKAAYTAARRAEFLEFAIAAPFPTTVLTGSDGPTQSEPRPDPSMRAAHVLVGAVDAERVPRLAEKRDELVRLDKEHGKARKPGR